MSAMVYVFRFQSYAGMQKTSKCRSGNHIRRVDQQFPGHHYNIIMIEVTGDSVRAEVNLVRIGWETAYSAQRGADVLR